MDALCSQNEEKIFSVGFSYNSVVYANTDIHPLDDISVHVILSATLLPFLQLLIRFFQKLQAVGQHAISNFVMQM